ncbi:MAG: tRNA (adenosine(37)-N6)-threonylcarbamoyltransferase complex transferase subunit TsaD [Oligoflexia bacterium]|nr:tRNA (adenosine(37)-N6)-threonylcarbamoyltransferase complex transferase subunit TsaD [Oligoflexia bacterium]
MLLLGIETSCDETAVALLEEAGSQPRVLAEEVASQTNVHELYGGVVPELASREHLRSLPILVDQVLHKAAVSTSDLGAVAVTQGPGLLGCLLVGINFAKGFTLANQIPLVGVNHIEAHLLSPRLACAQLEFPFLALVVSGGHTELHLVKEVGRYELLARTHDDAAGEAFDKSAHLLGFEYPGGPRLAAAADEFRLAGGSSRFKLPKVMQGSEGFSFSGLKTAIALMVKRATSADSAVRAELAHTVQEAIVDTLIGKVLEAKKRSGVTRVAVSGGVSANRRLRERLAQVVGGDVYFPDFKHCMDNAVMIAALGLERFRKCGVSSVEICARSRWPIESMEPLA